jgi:hypothetical protein
VSPIKTITAAFLALTGLLLVCLCVERAGASPAEIAGGMAMPEYTLFSAPETHLPLHLKPGKPQIVHLDTEVTDVTVDDKPSQVAAVVYSKTSIALFPRDAGAAHITARGKDGTPVMARYVVISPPAEKYVRLHHTCRKENDAACENTYVYYCPNLCYRTRIVASN